MTYDLERHHRQSIRLKGYDYTQAGAYFVTVVTKDRKCLFGEVVDGQMQLNEYGEDVQACWDDLPAHYPHVELDEFCIMPNHIHGIVVLTAPVGAGLKPAPTDAARHGLPEIMRAIKTFSARRINKRRNTSGVAVWQRNYYEHIIRNEESLNRIGEYIANNPLQWDMDRENPVFCVRDVGAGLKPAPTGDESWRV